MHLKYLGKMYNERDVYCFGLITRQIWCTDNF